ncbi:MAG TPA: hypothetical protein VGD17_08440 [Chitinophagaceae bacterium]
MKSNAIMRLGVLLLSFGVASNAIAQDTIPIKTLPPVTVTATTKKVPEKVWYSFKDYFSTVSNPQWYKLNKNYLASFILDEDKNNALFTQRGNLVYHISYGYEKSLPEELRKQVKGVYFDYDITRAIKVIGADRLIWVINLEDAKNLIMVRLEEGEMEEVKRLDKM